MLLLSFPAPRPAAGCDAPAGSSLTAGSFGCSSPAALAEAAAVPMLRSAWAEEFPWGTAISALMSKGCAEASSDLLVSDLSGAASPAAVSLPAGLPRPAAESPPGAASSPPGAASDPAEPLGWSTVPAVALCCPEATGWVTWRGREALPSSLPRLAALAGTAWRAAALPALPAAAAAGCLKEPAAGLLAPPSRSSQSSSPAAPPAPAPLPLPPLLVSSPPACLLPEACLARVPEPLERLPGGALGATGLLSCLPTVRTRRAPEVCRVRPAPLLLRLSTPPLAAADCSVLPELLILLGAAGCRVATSPALAPAPAWRPGGACIICTC